MEVLIKEGNLVLFQIEWEEGDFETSAMFNVEEVISYDGETEEVRETSHYLKGYVKWDGCSHYWFGSETGYLHLCGKSSLEQHKKVMDAIWEACSKKIKGWNDKVANNS